MARTALLISVGSTLALSLLSPAACTASATARAAIQAPPAQSKKNEQEKDTVRSVKRHTADFDREQRVKPDRPQEDTDNRVIVEKTEDEFLPPSQPREVNPVVMESHTPEPVKFWVWTGVLREELDLSNEYWSNENVFPLVRALTNVPFANGFNAPGYPVPQQRLGPDGLPLEIDPYASAQQMFGYIAWHREEMLERGRTQFQYAIWPQNWGTRNHHNPESELDNIFSLGGNPRDKLIGPGIVDDAEYESFYAANGIALNKMWSDGFVDHLDNLLSTAGITPPSALFFDLEAAFPNRKVMRWWTAALDDPRAEVELVDGIHTMAELEAQAPQYDPNQEIWRPANRQMYAYTHSVSQRVLEYALWEGFWEQAREVWPNVLLSNYDLHGAASGYSVPIARLNAKVESAPLRYADFASPILYGFPSYAINAADTLGEHLVRFGGVETGDPVRDRQELVIRFHKARLDSLAEAGTAIAPWICPPEFANLSIEQTIEVMNYGTDLGVRNWLFWSQTPYDWTPIVNAVTEYAETQAAASGSLED